MNEYGIEKISPSALTCYENCPKAFYYTVYLGLKLPQTKIHFEFGTAIHEAIDVMYQGRNEKGEWQDIKVAYKAIDTFKKRFDHKLLDDVSKEDYDAAVEDGVHILKAYWDEKEVLLAQGVDPTEFEIPGKDIMVNPETKEPLPVLLSYRLDGIGKGIVVEFKTSSSLYDVFEVRNRIQSLCYVWVYYQKYGVVPKLHYVIMIKKQKKACNRIQHLPLPYDIADIMAFDARVRVILEKIKNKEFNRPKRGHMPYCDCIKIEKELNIK